MPLRPCRECGKDVAESAAKCPHCGVDHPANKAAAAGQKMQQLGCALTLLITVPVLLAVLLLGGC